MNYENFFCELTEDILKFTKNGTINWENTLGKNKVSFEYIGDDKTEYRINLNWQFSTYGWKMEGKCLSVHPSNNLPVFYLFSSSLKNVEELINLLLDSIGGLKIDDSDLINDLESIKDGLSKSGYRKKRIEQINNYLAE